MAKRETKAGLRREIARLKRALETAIAFQKMRVVATPDDGSIKERVGFLSVCKYPLGAVPGKKEIGCVGDTRYTIA